MLGDKNSDVYVRTAWANADVALSQINKGKAEGSRTAIWVRSRLQAELFHLGCLVHCHPGKVTFVAILLLASFCVGLKSAVVNSKIEQLWVEEGGNVEKELRYQEAALGESRVSTHQMLIQTARDPEASVLHPSSLLKHAEVVRAAISLTVTLFDITWRLKDLCYSPSMPNFDTHYIDQIFENIIPCAIITPLDCFWEGSKLLGPDYPVPIPNLGKGTKVQWTNLNPQKLIESMKLIDTGFPYSTLEQHMKRAGITTGYQEKPCLNPHDPECPDSAPNKSSKTAPNVGVELTGGCYGFAAEYMHWPEELIVGGARRNKTGHILRAQALQTVVQLMGERELHDFWSDTYKVHHLDWTQQKAALVLDTWQRSFSREVQKIMRKENTTSSYNVFAFSTATLDEILSKFSQINLFKIGMGYVVMLVYAAGTLLRWNDPVRSQCAIGIAGIILVSVTVAAGLGFCAVLGIPFNASTTQIVPFLALGLGVDDVFLLTHTYAQEAANDTPPEEQTGVLLKKTGLSVLLTSLSNMCALFAAAIIPIPALRVFSLQSAVLVLFNLASALLVFPAIISLDLRRRSSGRYDLVCCYLPEPAETVRNRNRIKMMKEKYPTITRALPPDRQQTVTVLAPKKEGGGSEEESQQCLFPELTNASVGLSAMGSYYAPLIMKPCVRAFTFVLFFIVLGASVWGLFKVPDGLDLTDIVPQRTTEHEFLRLQGKHFGFYSMFAVTQGDFEYPTNQKLIYEYHEAFMRVQNIIKNDNGGLPHFWLSYFRDWLSGLQKAFDRDWKEGKITQERWYSNASDEGILAYKLLVQTGHVDNPIDKSLVSQVRLVDSDGVINPKAFYNYLSAWVTNDPLAYGASQGNLHPPPREWYHIPGDYDLKIPKSAPLLYTQLPFYLHGLSDTASITKMITQVREVCSKFEWRGLPNFPSGIPFLFWEQYIDLKQSLGVGVGMALTSIFVVMAALLFNIWAALLVVCLLASLVLQLLGFMGIVGIKLSAIPAALLILAVGISVHYIIHMVLSFMTAIGSRQRRAHMAVEHMFYPVANGAITMLLSVSMMAFSEFDFIVRNFFFMLAAVVGLGTVNGLVFLPVILSLMGPEAEVVPLIHPDRISTPSPEIPRKVWQTGGCKSTVGPRRGPAVSRPCHREPSLTTITEESSHSTQSQEPRPPSPPAPPPPAPTHEIIMEPEFVVETTCTGPSPGVPDSCSDCSSCSQHSEGPAAGTAPHITTKVTATAKLKFEVHTPLGQGAAGVRTRRHSDTESTCRHSHCS